MVFFLLSGLLLVGRFFWPVRALADFTEGNGCTQTVVDPGSGTTYNDVPSLACLGQVIISALNFLFSIVGAVIVVWFLSGAIRLILSRGDPKAIEGSQKTMTFAIFGGVFIVGAAIIVNLVFGTLSLPNPLTNFTLYQNSTGP